MKQLRLLPLALALYLFLLALVSSYINPQELGAKFLAQVGSVGISLGVAPNPDNTLAEEFRKKEDSLSARESDLAAREAALQSEARDSGKNNADATRYSLLGGIFLLALIIINYYLDFRARRMLQRVQVG